MLSKEEYVENIVRDVLNGEMKLEDFVAKHFELKKRYNNTKTSLDNILKECDTIFENFKILENMFDKLYSEVNSTKPYKWGDFKDFTNAIDSKTNRLCLIRSSTDEQYIYVWYFREFELLIIKKEEFGKNRFFPVQMANVGCE